MAGCKGNEIYGSCLYEINDMRYEIYLINLFLRNCRPVTMKCTSTEIIKGYHQLQDAVAASWVYESCLSPTQLSRSECMLRGALIRSDIQKIYTYVVYCAYILFH